MRHKTDKHTTNELQKYMLRPYIPTKYNNPRSLPASQFKSVLFSLIRQEKAKLLLLLKLANEKFLPQEQTVSYFQTVTGLYMIRRC